MMLVRLSRDHCPRIFLQYDGEVACVLFDVKTPRASGHVRFVLRLDKLLGGGRSEVHAICLAVTKPESIQASLYVPRVT